MRTSQSEILWVGWEYADSRLSFGKTIWQQSYGVKPASALATAWSPAATPQSWWDTRAVSPCDNPPAWPRKYFARTSADFGRTAETNSISLSPKSGARAEKHNSRRPG